MTEIIAIPGRENLRLLVEHDPHADSPLDWGHNVDIVRDSIGEFREVANHARESIRIYAEAVARLGNREKAVQVAQRVLSVYEVNDDVLRSVRIDGSRYIVAGPDSETIDWILPTYKQWAAGEVYGVILQERKRMMTCEVDGNDGIIDGTQVTYDEWDEADGDSALWSCYLDDEYTALDVAREMGWIEGGTK